MAEPNADTLAAATRGDQAAVSQLIERYLPGLRAFVRLRAGEVARGREDHSDIVQSACRDVLENLSRYQHGGDEGFRRWLYRTALRKIADRHEYYHAKKRDIGREGAMPTNWSGAGDHTPTPSQHAIAHEEAMRIDRALDALPDDYREVIVLARYVGMSHREIAEEMGRSEVAVRTLLSRALARLAELLDDESATDG
ncbi:MAG: sigma-70 family RNA polymerase sigma factor [Planctomycetota bacterium]